MTKFKALILLISVIILAGCSLFSNSTVVETTTDIGKSKTLPSAYFITPAVIDDNTINFGVSINDVDDTIIELAILLKHNEEIVDELTEGINSNGVTENLSFFGLEKNKIYKLVIIATYNTGVLHEDVELADYNFSTSEDEVEPVGSILNFDLVDDIAYFSIEVMDMSDIITSIKVVIKKDLEIIDEISSGINFDGITNSLSFSNLEQNTNYVIELIATYIINNETINKVLATQSFKTDIWLGAAVKTVVKIDGVLFMFEVVNVDKVKQLKVVNKNTNEEFIVENNTITLTGNYNETYSYDIIMVDNNDNEILLKSLIIKPGTNITPYEISNVEDLQKINYNLDAVYKLTNNIDLINKEWEPIATNFETPFKGVFDGNGYIIDNLTLTGDYEFGGLFGINSGEIKNVQLENTYINIEGFAGGIASINLDGSIKDCSVSGQISADLVGGVVGANYSLEYQANIDNISTDVILSGITVGGVVGENYSNIKNSYAWGEVIALSNNDYYYSYAGGLVGINYETGNIKNSYAATSLTSTVDNAYQGGLVGSNSGKIDNCFAIGDVEATQYTGGLVGINYFADNYHKKFGEINNSFRFVGQIVKSNKYKNIYGEDVGLTELTSTNWYMSTLGWDDNWQISVVSDGYLPVHIKNEPSKLIPTEYQIGSIGNPIEITTREELINIKNNLYYAYKLMNDIDLSGENWIPIGNSTSPFVGLFDGNGYKISNLTINIDRDNDDMYFGLFGSSLTTIKNVSLENINYNIDSLSIIDIGGIVGNNKGSLLNSYVTGSIQAEYFSVTIGGLAGSNTGKVFNSYADVNITVSANYKIKLGGLVGYNSGIIGNSFSLGEITSDLDLGGNSDANVGGLVGEIDYEEGQIINSFTITNVITNGSAGRLVGNNEDVDNSLNNVYYYEYQTIVDFDGNELMPVDNSYNNILITYDTNLCEENWYKNILEFCEDIWDFSQVSENNYPQLNCCYEDNDK